MPATKRWLFSVLALGLIAYSGAGGTFASFTAQTTNAGSTLSSGTLTLSNSVNSANTCYTAATSTVNSKQVTPVGNVNSNCANVVAATNIEPGSWNTASQQSTVTIQNTGSLNASNFWLEAPSTTDCVDSPTTSSSVAGATVGTGLNFNAVALNISSASLTSGSKSVSTTAANGFTGVAVGMLVTGTGVPANTTVSTVSGSTLTLSANATATVSSETLQFSVVVSSVTLAANSATATATAFPNVAAGMLVTGTGVPAGTVVAAVAGTTLTLSQVATASGTVALTFGGNALCQSMLMYVQESAVVSGQTDYYCWYGYGGSGAVTGQSEASNDGLCAAPVDTTLGTALSANTAITSVTFATLTGPVYGGDAIVVTNDAGYSSTGCTVNNTHSTKVYLPSATAVSIPVTCTATPTQAFGTDSTVVDSTENGHLDGDTIDTVANFDTLHAANLGPLELYQINGAGTVNTLTTAAQLTAQQSRTFTVGLYLPNPVNNQNDLQGLQSTFGLTWYASQ